MIRSGNIDRPKLHRILSWWMRAIQALSSHDMQIILHVTQYHERWLCCHLNTHGMHVDKQRRAMQEHISLKYHISKRRYFHRDRVMMHMFHKYWPDNLFHSNEDVYISEQTTDDVLAICTRNLPNGLCMWAVTTILTAFIDHHWRQLQNHRNTST